jgi:hypothetical protein
VSHDNATTLPRRLHPRAALGRRRAADIVGFSLSARARTVRYGSRPSQLFLNRNQRGPPSEAIFTPTLAGRLLSLTGVSFGADAWVDAFESKKSAHA